MTMFPEGSQPVLRVPTPPTEVPVQSFSVHTALCSLLVKDCGQPRSLLNGAFNYTTREGVNTYEARIQYCCHEPFYKMHTKDGTSESKRGRDTCKWLSSPSCWESSAISSNRISKEGILRYLSRALASGVPRGF